MSIAIPDIYRQGAIILTNGSNQVTGLGANFPAYVLLGAQLTVDGDVTLYTVETIDTRHDLTLTAPWAGATGEYVYQIDNTVVPEPSYTIDKTTIDADGVDAATITVLPNPTYVSMTPLTDNGVAALSPQLVSDSQLVIKIPVAGDYEFLITTFGYRDYKVTIHAT